MAESVNIPWNIPASLSACYKGTFAYDTIKERLPSILTKTIDAVHRMKNDIKQQYGEKGMDEVKAIVGAMSKLRNELQTDKPITPLCDVPQAEIWNRYLETKEKKHGFVPSWFKSPWLYVECYMYKRIHQGILACSLLKELDPFKSQKDIAFVSSMEATACLLAYLRDITKTVGKLDQNGVRILFEQFIEVDLWGNKCDLSISGGADNFQASNPLAQLDDYRPFLLIDNMAQLWRCLEEANMDRPDKVRLDIVLDNAGFELVTDLVLAEFLLAAKLVHKVVFHPKNIPWFVSDVTKHDFHWTINQFEISDNASVSHFGTIWKERLASDQWSLYEHMFWTLPHDYSDMEAIAPDLYHELGNSNLVLFKGDLNYRKLVGDRNWPHTTSYQVALRGFQPAPLCALRTLKADVVVGLKEGQTKKAEGENKNWMVVGEYAVIQFCDKNI